MEFRRLVAALLLCAAAAFGAEPKRGESLCFAFLMRGDLFVHCGGQVRQVTRLGTVDEFAIDSEARRVALAFDEVHTPIDEFSSEASSTIRTVELPTGAVRLGPTGGQILATCGGLFILEKEDQPAQDLWNEGAVLEELRYGARHCSRDRGVRIKEGKSDWVGLLWKWEGETQEVKGAQRQPYALSPRGDILVYQTKDQLCRQSWGAEAQCVPFSLVPDELSVNDRGETLMGLGTGNSCYFRSRTNFWPEPIYPEVKIAKDECSGIAWWDGVAKDVRFLVGIGRAPQWIEPAMAEEMVKKADLLGRR